MSKKSSDKKTKRNRRAAARQRQPAAVDLDLDQLLYSRSQARRLLGGVSNAKLLRLEKLGVLKPIRLDPQSMGSMVYYKRDNLLQVADAAS